MSHKSWKTHFKARQAKKKLGEKKKVSIYSAGIFKEG